MHSRQRFTGQERDGVAGLDDFNARSLQMRTGRMNRPDPLFGNAPVNPQRWNRYAYVMSSPLRFTDPSGLEAESVFRATVIGYTCALTNCVSVNAGLHVRPDIQSSVFDTLFYLNFTFESGDGGFGVGADEGGGGGGQPPPAPPPAENKKPPASGAANNDNFISYLLQRPWVVSWILPVAGLVPGVVGVGPAGGVAWNPQSHYLCVGIGLGVSAGHNAAIGPLTARSGNVDSILSGWSASAGANLPVPSPTAGLGWQVVANFSGVAQGPTAGVAGLSGSVTWSGCASIW